MLPTLGLLLSCQLLGEVAARSLGLPIPGPVFGLALLVLILWARPGVGDSLRETVAIILGNLSLMFVPAGVGVIGNLRVLSEDWLALLIILMTSTLLAMLATVVTFIAASRFMGGGAE